MGARSLRNIFISVGLLFALARLLAAGTNNVVLNFNEMPRGRSQPTFITFDPPGSTNTFPGGINSAGVITGFYNAGSFVTHGFVRARDGTITTFDGPNDIFGTVGSGINSAGVITGYYSDAVNTHGFLRAPNGSLTTFDVPGAVSGTFPVGINEGGVVTGGYCDAVNCHSFVRDRDGTITTFDPAMVPNNSGIINPAGAITGYFFDLFPPFLAHGFVRDPKATITIFDAPNVCQQGNGTFATGINPRGLVVGGYYDANCETFHGFLRSRDGAFTTIDVPGAVATECDAINLGGAISGVYFTSSAIFGFLRSPNGNFTTYSAPAGSFGPNDKAISPTGAITGFYSDANGVSHGYLWSAK